MEQLRNNESSEASADETEPFDDDEQDMAELNLLRSCQVQQHFTYYVLQQYSIDATLSAFDEIKMTNAKSTMTISKVQSTEGSNIMARNNVLFEHCTFS
jgi:hypothetical protein